MAARATTSPERTKLRKEGQFSKLWLAIRKPTVIYRARTLGDPNATSGTNIRYPQDMVGVVPFDRGSGTLGDVKAEMAMYVGTSLGGRDVGVCRIRKAPISGTFYIGEESEIAWTNDLYLTVVDDELGIWPKHLKIYGASDFRMDFDIDYTDQHTDANPIVLMRFDAVLWLTGATVSITWPSVSTSYDPLGTATISSYSWTAPGASATSGLTTATPTFTYNAPGQYRVYCTVTMSNGKSGKGARTIYVYSAASLPVEKFKLTTSPRGSADDGGWSFEVELYDEADIADVHDRAKVILFAQDYYGTEEVSIGPVAGYENIVCVGWIDGDTIEMDPVNGAVKFKVSGAQEWLKRITGWPVGVENVTVTPTEWTEIQGLTVRKFLWHMLHWRTNALIQMDAHLVNDSRRMRSLDNMQNTLWEQIQVAARDTILGQPLVDRYGGLYVRVAAQLTPASGRSTFPVIMNLTKQDWQGSLTIIKRDVPDIGRVELSGVARADAAKPIPLFSLAPGHVSKRYGDVTPIDNLVLANQAGANQLAGLILGYHNRKYDFEIDMYHNNRMVDIAPECYLGVDVQTGDNLRGISYTGNVLPVTVEYAYDEEQHRFSTRVEAQQESVEDLSIDGDIPPESTSPPPPPIPPPPEPPPAPPPPGEPPGAGKVVIFVNGVGFFYCADLSAPTPAWIAMNSGLDANRINGFISFDATITGALFMHTYNGGSGFGTGDNSAWPFGGNEINSEIWYCPGVGQTWTRVIHNFQLTPSSYPFPRGPLIMCMTVDRSAEDTVYLIGTGTYTILGNSIQQGYIGGSGGFSRQGGNLGMAVDVTTGLGKMVVLEDGSIAVATDGFLGMTTTAMTSLSTILKPYAGGKGIVTSSASPSLGAIAHGNLTEIAVGGNPFANDPAMPEVYGHDLVGLALYEASGVGPDGLAMCIGDHAGILLKRSTDGGVTWGNSPSISGTTTALWCWGDIGIWLAGNAHRVLWTDDMFTTYTDKTGDLGTWATLPNIMAIRTVPSAS